MDEPLLLSDIKRKPRPWFISISALWSDDNNAFDRLNNELSDLNISNIIPYHQIQVPEIVRHFTVFAILKINGTPCTSTSFREFSKELFSLIVSPRIVQELTRLFSTGLDVEAYEVRSYDDATTIQFRTNGQLQTFRDNARHLFSEEVSKLVFRYPDKLVESLLEDCGKSRGDHAFGSISRSPSPIDISIERWRMDINIPIKFEFRKIHILTSDQGLTNPRKQGEEDIYISSQQ